MKASYLIAVVALFLCFGPVGAEQVVVGQASGKIAATITLHKSTPSIIMWNLGLFSFGGNNSLWQKDNDAVAFRSGAARCASPVLPTVDPCNKPASGISLGNADVDMSGIDLVVPSDSEHVLVVYGTKAAVEKLKSAVAKMDVTPRQVAIKAEVVSIDTEAEKKLGFLDQAISSLSKSQVEGIRTSLHENGAEWINSPVLSIVAGIPAEISVKSDLSSFQMQALPKINVDGTITLAISLSFNESNPERKHSLFTQRRTADGETVLLGGFVDNSSVPKTLIVLLTPEIID